jgi:hypothetical protein
MPGWRARKHKTKTDDNAPPILQFFVLAGWVVLDTRDVGHGCLDALIWHPPSGLLFWLDTKNPTHWAGRQGLNKKQTAFAKLWARIIPTRVAWTVEDAMAVHQEAIAKLKPALTAVGVKEGK